MFLFPPTLILRHRKENLKKCSLRGLEQNPNFFFLTYPTDPIPDLSKYVLLTLDAPPLTIKDAFSGLFLIDATWKYSEKMLKRICTHQVAMRSLPLGFQTAYPRRQEDCKDPNRGLASIEALYLAYKILNREAEFLLKNYYWKDIFLQKNHYKTNLYY